MNFANSVRIDGKIVGDLLVDSGAAGIIRRRPRRRSAAISMRIGVLVAGKVHGNIRAADSVHLMSTAKGAAISRICVDIDRVRRAVSTGCSWTS